jgi:hypothetical protein
MFSTAFPIWGALETVVKKNQMTRQVLDQACARIGQRSENRETGFMCLVLKKSAFPKSLEEEKVGIAIWLVESG